MLAHLSSLKIRGAFYTAAEAARLGEVRLRASPRAADRALFPCCAHSHARPGAVGVCSRHDAGGVPAGGAFACRGDFQHAVTITAVRPRFSRRSGGATVTVEGENFGVTGAGSILRVAGKSAHNCRFPANSFP